MEEDSLIEDKTTGKIEIQDVEIEKHPEEEKNIDEAVTTIDEVETDDQGQLEANAGGSGEAEVYETGEEDVVVGKDPSLVENEDKSETGYVSGEINTDGANPNFGKIEVELPSEEDNAWFDSKVDEYGTVLH